jgi:tetraacyldisaccharide 4'-kinase
MTTKILTKTLKRIVLLPLTAIYALALVIRHVLYDVGVLKSSRGAIPTLVIGNIHVGGTGKTPHASAFLSILSKKLGGEKYVALLSRGYRRKSKGFKWVFKDSEWSDVGDEPSLLKSLHPLHSVAVCENRIYGIERIAKEKPEVKVVVLDDGLQHRALIPDMSVLLIDSDRPLNNSSLLPGGELRDLKCRSSKFDAWIYTRCPSDFTPPKLSTTSPPEFIFSTYMSSSSSSLNEFKNDSIKSEKPRVLAVSGIANPERFFDELSDSCTVVKSQSYSDHYQFNSKDVADWVACIRSEKLDAIVTTAKDAVRIKPYTQELRGISLIVIPIEVKWHEKEAIEKLVDKWLESPIFANDTAKEIE